MFTDWKKKIAPECEKIGPLLSAELSDEPNALESQLRTLEAWSYRILKLMSEAEQWFTVARAEALFNCAEDLKALDKEIFIDDYCKEQRQYYVMFRGIIGDSHQQGILSRKISLGQTILKYQEKLLKTLE